jgi:hypothetical protein
MPEILSSTATTVFRDRLAVMVECDYRDDSGDSARLTELTRLDNGDMRDEDTQTRIRQLRTMLGIKDTKNLAGAIFSKNLGAYFTKISLEARFFWNELVIKFWDANPIEEAEVAMVHPGDDLKCHRISRCTNLSLHLVEFRAAQVFGFLKNLNLRCSYLELRNINTTGNVVAQWSQRLGYKIKLVENPNANRQSTGVDQATSS